MRHQRRLRRHLALLTTGALLALATLVALPTAAFAGATQVDSSGDPATVTVTADATDNAIRISDSATFVRVEDPQGVTPTGDCVADPIVANTARCPKPAGGVLEIVVILGDGIDVLTSSALSEPLDVSGGLGNDRIGGGDEDDRLDGQDGDDVLDGDAGGDELIGGSGVDTADYDGTADITVTLDGLANDGVAGEGDNVQTENVTAADGNDTLTGGAGMNSLAGGMGNDTLDGGPDGDILDGGQGFDTATYATRTNPVIVNLNSTADDGEAGENDLVRTDVERVIGGSAADELTGSASNNRLEGGAGADTLRGSGGDDVLVGGDGGDTFIGGTHAAVGDTVSYSDAAGPVTVTIGAGVANDGVSGEGDDVQASVENVTGSLRSDVITGSVANNRLNGLAGNDETNGSGGNDVLVGGDGADVGRGGAGADRLSGSRGRDQLFGGPGNDTLNGGLARDVCRGGPGTDTVSKCEA